jgi:hypothetical protein
LLFCSVKALEANMKIFCIIQYEPNDAKGFCPLVVGLFTVVCVNSPVIGVYVIFSPDIIRLRAVLVRAKLRDSTVVWRGGIFLRRPLVSLMRELPQGR